MPTLQHLYHYLIVLPVHGAAPIFYFKGPFLWGSPPSPNVCGPHQTMIAVQSLHFKFWWRYTLKFVCLKIQSKCVALVFDTKWTLPSKILEFLFSEVSKKILKNHFAKDIALPLSGPNDHPRMRSSETWNTKEEFLILKTRKSRNSK